MMHFLFLTMTGVFACLTLAFTAVMAHPRGDTNTSFVGMVLGVAFTAAFAHWGLGL